MPSGGPHFEAAEGAFYAEFLTPLIGSEFDRRGERKVTLEVGGVSSQRLRFVDLLLIAPWKIRLDGANDKGRTAVSRASEHSAEAGIDDSRKIL